MAIFNGTKHAETITGTAADDRIFGDNGNDILRGAAGNDFIDGGNGSDTLDGGSGNDEIDGGNGQDTVVLVGNRNQYHLTQRGDGLVIVRDLRPGSPDGTDRLVSIERVQFADGIFKIVDLISTNAAPVAGNDAVTLAEDSGAVELTATLLANDSDADGDALTVSAVQALSAQGAAVTLGPDGKVSYDSGSLFAGLRAGQTATDSFTYTVRDSTGLTSTATATVTITGKSDAPIALDDALSLSEDSPATDVTATLLGTDSDPDGETFAITAVQAVSDKGAVVTLGPDGKASYDPGSVFAGLETGQSATDKFTYTITDSAGLTSTATATVTIAGKSPPPPPVQYDAWYYVFEDDSTQDLLGSIIETFGFEVVAVETAGTLGTVAFDLEGGILNFTADHASTDPYTFDQTQETWFTVVGDEGQRKVIGIYIGGVNDEIVAVDDEVALAEGQATGNLWTAIVGNDLDPDNGVNSRRIASLDTTGTLGTLTFDAQTQTLVYSAEALDIDPGSFLTDTFTYTVTDGVGPSSTATVTVTVMGMEDGSARMSVAPSGGESILSAFAPQGAPSDAAFAGLGFAAPEPILGAELIVLA